jgi:CubicO group peptidase (beta-lactamase class C family)
MSRIIVKPSKYSLFFVFLAWTHSGLFAQLDNQLQSIFEDYQLMGMSVVKVCSDNMESYHYGLRDYTRELPVDDSTMYRIASISKTVSAMGLMKLYDQGLFELDDDVSDYLGFELRNPNWPEVPITFRMILSHTSSIQDGGGYSDFLSASFSFNATPPAMSELLTEQGGWYTPNMFRQEEPGTFFAYSNINYGIVGTLIEAISGQRFDVFMKENILMPLGIAGSYNVSDIQNIDNVAVLYRNQDGWTAQADNFQGEDPIPLFLGAYTIGTNGLLFGPQGGLRIAPSDLARILMVMKYGSYSGTEILDTATVALMQTPQWIYNGNNGDNYYGLFRSWGLGIHCTTDTSGGDLIFAGAEFKGHPGEAYGLISDMYWFSDNSLPAGFIFMTNGAYNGFEFGNQSAYYSLEEEVFQAICSNNFQDCFLGVNDIETSMSIEVFPNPSRGIFTISGNLSYNKDMWASVRNPLGSEVAHVIVGHDQSLDLTGLTPGVYSLLIQDLSGKIANCKFVIQ